MDHALFRMKDGKATITDHARSIWIYNDLIERYGDKIALKLFRVFDYMADLSLDNPYSQVSEIEKLETIIRGTCPEITLEVDWNDDIILEAIEYTRKLYETQTYRKYLATKTLVDKITAAIQFSEVNTSKEGGNSGEINKALALFSITDAETKKLYAEYLEECGSVQVRGRGKQSSKISSNMGKSEELD